jgi:cation efflux family protein
VSADTNRRRLVVALALIVAFMAGEVIAGILAHSLALLSDASHMLTDAAAIGLSLVALALADAQACGTSGGRSRTLTDPAAREVHFEPRPDSIARLVTLTPPAQLGARTKAEKVTVSMGVRLIATKLEPDGDIHLIVGEPSNLVTTMIVEFPDLGCTRGAQHRWAMELAK